MFKLYLKILQFEINIPLVLTITISNKIGKVKKNNLQSDLFQLNTVCLIFLTDFFSV